MDHGGSQALTSIITQRHPETRSKGQLASVMLEMEQ